MVLSRQCEGVLFVFWIALCTLQLPLLLPLVVFLCSGIRWSYHWRWTSETVLRWCGRDWWESRRTVNRRYRTPCTVYWYPLQTTRNCNRRRKQVTVFFHSVFAAWALSSPAQNYVRSHAILFLHFPLPFSRSCQRGPKWNPVLQCISVYFRLVVVTSLMT